MRSLMPWKNKKENTVPALRDNWFSRIFDDPFNDFLPAGKDSFFSSMPSVDVKENKKEYSVRAEIPGMTEKDINLTLNDGVLNIKGEKKEENEEKSDESYYSECRYGSFSRSIPLGKNVKWEDAKAKYKNGVLTVTVPKSKTSEEKPIEIKID